MSKSWLVLALSVVISTPCSTTPSTHKQAELGTVAQQINTRPVAVVCPQTKKKYDPKITDYKGKKISLVEPGGDKPTLVIIASADSKDEVLQFLADFAGPVWNYKKKSRYFWGVAQNSGGLFSDYWNGEEGWLGSVGPAWKNFKNEMGKMEDLRVLIFADARPIYKDKLAAGLEEAEEEREGAVERGRKQGKAKGEQIGAQKGRERSLPIFRRIFGVAENIGREKGREEGARQGSELGAKVADTIIPPYVAFMAETELMKKADELLPAVKKILEKKLVKDFDSQSWISILVDEKDFEGGLTEKGKKAVEWANTYLDKSKQLNTDEAIKMHASFLQKTNSAEALMKGMIGKSDAGFHVALIDPNGNPLKSWSDKKIDPDAISAEYLKYMEHLQGVRNIEGCPAVK